MKLDSAIAKQKVIEVNSYNEKISYSGVCIFASSEVWVLVNYDLENGIFDGYTIFKSSKVDSYSIYDQKSLIKSKNTINSYIDGFKNFYQFDSFEEMFFEISKVYLTAIFVKETMNEYYVGKLIKNNSKSFVIQTYRTDGEIGVTRRILKNNLKYFSFGTNYEKELENIIASKRL